MTGFPVVGAEYGVWGSLLNSVSVFPMQELCSGLQQQVELFAGGVGLHQGCALSQVLSVIFMDRISRCRCWV